MTVRSTVHGFPRIGDRRELKTATEGYWAGRVPAEELEATARELRRQTWSFLGDAGIGQVPSNHFSLYDQVLDTCVLVGAVPGRYGRSASADVDLDTYFAMARGRADATAMEMTKWFDTNYHYLVPELGPEVEFRLAATPKPLVELAEARELGIATRPVLLGPVTFLLLGKAADGTPAGFDRLSLLDPLLEVYAELLDELEAAGAEWVQLDEPAFVQDRSPAELDALARAYDRLGRASAPAQAAGLQLLRPPGRRPRGPRRRPGRRHRPRPDPGRRPQPRAAGRHRRHRRPDPGRRGGRRPQRLGQRPRAVAVHPGHPARPGRRRGRVDLLLAPARPDRP